MRAELEMELEDVPGQLVKALEPISRFGGNILNVLHQRERKTPLGRVPVRVIFDVDERPKLNRIINALRKMDIRIIRVGERGGVRATVMLIGKAIHTELKGIVERVNQARGVRVIDLSLAMGPGEESAARATLLADTKAKAVDALRRLGKIAAEKDLMLIQSLEEAK